MSSTTPPPPGTFSGAAPDTKDEIKQARHHDVIGAQLYGAGQPKATSLESEIFKDNRCPLQGAELGAIGAEYDFQFTANPNPPEGFAINMVDGTHSADELIQYQIMKGGYDGKMKLLIEYNRPYVPGLNNPYVSITTFQKETAIEKICGPLPDGIKLGTLMEWRENAWKEEAKKILRQYNAYNPKTQEVCRLTRKFVSTDITGQRPDFTLRHEDQLIFREEEVIEVQSLAVQQMPKVRYLENFFRCLGEIKDALGYK
jgi:hypothetical protein